MITNELRINNKVLWKDRIWAVIGIDTDPRTPSADSVMLCDKDDWEEVFVSELEGVELSYDLLDSMGVKDSLTKGKFIPIETDGEWTTSAVVVKFVLNEPTIWLYINGDMSKLKGIKYLHQLQNIVFAVSGEELDISNLEPKERDILAELKAFIDTLGSDEYIRQQKSEREHTEALYYAQFLDIWRVMSDKTHDEIIKADGGRCELFNKFLSRYKQNGDFILKSEK